jgi:O-antigen/teichoic acid export membrane protein
VAVWQIVGALAQLAQIALVTHTLGLAQYGRLALVIASVMLVSQVFDMRVGVAATTFGAEKLRNDPKQARGLFQLTYLIDGATGVVGFVIVVALALIFGQTLLGDGGTTPLILYAVVVLASTVDESSVSVLRLLDKFRLMAICGTALECVRVVLVAGALAVDPSLVSVVLALVAAALIGAVIQLCAVSVVFRRSVDGTSIFTPALDAVWGERRAVIRTVFNTNVVSYVRLVQIYLPTVFVGALAGATQVGVYKVGTAAGAALGKVADPALVALLPRVSRMWAEGRVADIRRLIRHVSYASVGLAVMGVVLIVGPFAEPFLELVGGSEAARTAKDVLVLGALAFGLNAALFWNGAVLYAAGRSGLASRIALLTGATQLVLLVPLTAFFDAEGAAAALLGSMAVGNGVAAVKAWRCLRLDERKSGAGSGHNRQRDPQTASAGR